MSHLLDEIVASKVLKDLVKFNIVLVNAIQLCIFVIVHVVLTSILIPVLPHEYN